MDAQTYNRQLDAYLSSTGIVDAALFAKLLEAHAYDAASTVGWLNAKLRILAGRVKRGDQVTLYDPASRQTFAATTGRELATWVEQHFPNAHYDHMAT